MPKKCLIYLPFIIIVVFSGCNFYFTKHQLKQKHILPYHDIKSKEYYYNLKWVRNLKIQIQKITYTPF